MENKNPTIDTAKGIAIILVVYGHVIQNSMAPFGHDFFLVPVFKVIYAFHMPLFIFISGYLMAGSLKRHSSADVFKKKWRGLFIPFVSLTVFGFLITDVLNSIFGEDPSPSYLIKEAMEQLFVNPKVWFLWTLFVSSFLLIISVDLGKKAGLFIFLVVYLLLMAIPYNNDCDLCYIKWFYLFYLAGYFLNEYSIVIPSPAVKTTLFMFSLGLFALLMPHWVKNDYIYINQMHLTWAQHGREFLRFIYRYTMGFLGIGIAFYTSEKISQTRISSWLGHLGNYSMDIYIIQMLILQGIYPLCIRKAGIDLDFNSPWVCYLLAPMVSMGMIGTCLLTSRLIIRKSHLLNVLLLGGRHSVSQIRP